MDINEQITYIAKFTRNVLGKKARFDDSTKTIIFPCSFPHDVASRFTIYATYLMFVGVYHFTFFYIQFFLSLSVPFVDFIKLK